MAQRHGKDLASPYGVHRVLEPEGVLPQAAWKIDNSPKIRCNEILVDVKTLNIDAASFKQILSTCPWGIESEKEKHVEKTILEIVEKRGKMHNPVTGSGGMLLGTIREFGGPKVQGREGAREGDLIATLVSLSLTPLQIHKINRVYLDKDQVDIEGAAVIFETGPFAVIPPDLDERLALAVLDVAGAPIQTERLVKPGDRVLVLGAGGKSGLMCTAVAKKRTGPEGSVIALAHSERSAERVRRLGSADVVLQGDATDAVSIMDMVMAHNDERKVDLAINCVNVPGTEMASILSTRDGGKVYFFSMATSFTAAALGAEGAGADVELVIGNGYARGHAVHALNLVRTDSRLRDILTEMFTV